MAFTRITDSDLANKGVVGLPDTPNLSTGEMQRKFDEIATDVIVPKFNELAEELDEIGLDKVARSDDVTDFKLDDEGRLMISTNHGETFGYAGSTGHQIIDGSGTKYPARANLQFSQNVTIRDYDENNGNKTFLSVSGEKGEPGKAATITIGNVESGDEAKVENVGSSTNAIFNMTFPKGNKGDAATIQVGTVRSGENASVSNRGTSSEAIFDFTLPKGEKGDTGQGINILGEYDTLAELQTAHPTGNPGNAYMIGTENPKDLYVWDVDNTRWANQGALQGVKGDTGEAGSIAIGVVTEGDTIAVENVGTSQEAIFNFTLKKGDKGDKGDAGTIAVGVVESGDEASVTNVGTPESAVFDFVIPRGEKGERGNPTVINGKEGALVTLFGTDIKVDEDSDENLKEYIERNGGGSLIRVYASQDNFGETITFTIAGTTQSATIPVASPYMVSFSTPELGEAIITNETTRSTKEIDITTYSLYEVNMSNSFNYNDWLTLGGITKTFASLDEVLADEPTIRILMTKHASVDYLAGIVEPNEDVTKIIYNDLCAKWINLRDYALDTLYANPILKAEMDRADKYFYGEWALAAQVPKMTSNTAPYGEVVFSSFTESTRLPYYAFNGGNTPWMEASERKQGFIGYKFINPIEIKSAKFTMATSVQNIVYLVYSDDGTTWNRTDGSIISDGSNISRNIESSGYGSHLYWALQFNTTVDNNHATYGVQFYAWQPKGNVPVMTSNTAPYGEAFASSYYSSSSTYPAWKAFDRALTSADSWVSANGSVTNQYVGYKFVNPICAKAIELTNRNDSYPNAPKNFRVEASNTGVWSGEQVVLGTFENNDNTATHSARYEFENDKYYLYYRIFIVDCLGSGNIGVGELQFYGRELKVSVPTMTSNTEPWGEAKASSFYPNAFWTDKQYNVFNTDATNGWYANNKIANEWIQYEFEKEVVIKHLYMGNFSNDNNTTYIKKFILQGYNGNEFEDIGTFENTSSAKSVINGYSVNNDKEYKIYRIKVVTSFSTTTVGLAILNFFGLDYSEHEERHYIYDHGVEVEEIEIASNSATAVKEIERLYGKMTSSSSYNYISFYTNKIDAARYKLIRMITDVNLIPSSSVVFCVLATHSAIPSNLANLSERLAYSLVNKDSLPNNSSADISSLNNECYFSISSRSDSSGKNEFSVSEWWLE